MAQFGTYSFKSENATFGIIEIDGFADGDDVVNISPIEDTFTAVSGAKGDVTRVQNANEMVEVTVRLIQSSAAAKLLINSYLADRETGDGVQPLVISNAKTGEVYTIPKAWIIRMPARVRGQGHNPWEIVFHGNKLLPVTGA